MRYHDTRITVMLCALVAASISNCIKAFNDIGLPHYSSLDIDDIFEQRIYLKSSETQEVVVVSVADGGLAGIQQNDYITHVDGVKVFTGGLTTFLLHGDSDAAIPVVDDEDSVRDGSRLLGFLKIQSSSYGQKGRKSVIALRRGEYEYNNIETSLDRSLLLPGSVLPQHGGGTCITSKDCFFGNGTCIHQMCHCYDSQTGPQCQIRCSAEESKALGLLRKEREEEDILLEDRRLAEVLRIEAEAKAAESVKRIENASIQSARRRSQEASDREQANSKATLTAEGKTAPGNRKKVKGKMKAKPKAGAVRKVKPSPSLQNRDLGVPLTEVPDAKQPGQQVDDTPTRNKVKNISMTDRNSGIDERAQTMREGEGGAEVVLREIEREIERNTAHTNQKGDSGNDYRAVEIESHSTMNSNDEDNRNRHNERNDQDNINDGRNRNDVDHRHEQEQHEQEQQVQEEEPSVENLYGHGKRYPEPYLAGKPPNELVHLRQQRKRAGQSFIYAVRFRMGPLGLSFDNRVSDATVVERVAPRMQADTSDIQVGDVVIAVDQFDTRTAPGKVTQRIIGTLSWPMIIVFETRVVANSSQETEASMKRRLYNLNIIYPPSLVSVAPLQILLAGWTAEFNVSGRNSFTDNSDSGDENVDDSDRHGNDDGNSCPVYLLKTAEDLFGCEMREFEFSIPDAIRNIGNTGGKDLQIEASNPMLSMLSLLSLGASDPFSISVRSLALMKRGVCAFTEKARGLQDSRAELGLVVNTEDGLTDMPAGKEEAKTSRPLGIMKETDGYLLQQAAVRGEVLAVISDPEEGPSHTCALTLSLASTILNKWPHSVPSLPISTVLDMKPGLEVRPASEQGGRIAVSGDNGWAFFDYHLAMFGPQEVPKGSFRLQMAYPPSGCDPSAYTVRIKGTVVALLRGGGCSFGIKVINAQKLGAIAVIVVNTDDQKTMRIMASNDEVPLINIPCIMVSRRLQHYLEEKLNKYYLSNQHFISFDPTGIFGEYEAKGAVSMPLR